MPDPSSPEARYAVAYSGGLDSTVLLAAMTRIAGSGALRALHVDHGLHPDSAEWARHCEQVCGALRVACVVRRVAVDTCLGVGVEAAARRARYAALAHELDRAETLLTAHHADDQLETLLLRLMRGTGVRGLRGILPVARLGPALVARPLLGFTRAELAAAAGRWGLDWLEDPSNRSLDFDRNLIRSRVAPILRERWGDSAAQRAGRCADAMRDAEAVLGEVARRDLAAAGAERGRLPLEPLRALGAARQRNVLRRAIRDAGLPMPDARRLEALRRAIGREPAESVPRVEWRGAEARIHRDRMYLLAEGRLAGEPGAKTGPRVRAGEPWQGREGQLVLEPAGTAEATGLPESWARAGLDVRFRRGGERFKPAGAAHHRTLKAWLRENDVVPWMRNRIPLLYFDERIVAIADLAMDDAACRARADEPRWRVRWIDHPRID